MVDTCIHSIGLENTAKPIPQIERLDSHSPDLAAGIDRYDHKRCELAYDSRDAVLFICISIVCPVANQPAADISNLKDAEQAFVIHARTLSVPDPLAVRPRSGIDMVPIDHPSNVSPQTSIVLAIPKNRFASLFYWQSAGSMYNWAEEKIANQFVVFEHTTDFSDFPRGIRSPSSPPSRENAAAKFHVVEIGFALRCSPSGAQERSMQATSHRLGLIIS